MADDVRLDISGEAGDAIKSIAEFKAALKTLNDETVKVTAKQKEQRKAAEGARRSTKAFGETARTSATQMRAHGRSAQSAAKMVGELRDVMRDLSKQVTALNRNMGKNIEKTNESFKGLRRTIRGLNTDMTKGVTVTHHMVSSQKSLGAAMRGTTKDVKDSDKAFTMFLHTTQKVMNRLSGRSLVDFGRRGVRPLNIAIAAAIAGIAMLGNQIISLTGLLGALPASLGGLGGMFIALKSAKFGDVTKALDDLEKLQRKLNSSSKTGEAREKELATAQDKRREIMAGLTRTQKEALPFFQQMRDLSKDIGNISRKELAPALKSVGVILDANGKTIRSFVREGGRNVTAGAKLAEKLFTTKAAKKDLADLTNQSAFLGHVFAEAGVRVARGLLAISAEARPLVAWLGGGIDDLAKKFAKWSTSVEGRKSIGRFFRDAIVNARLFGSIISNLAQSIKALFNAAQPSGDSFLRWLDEATNRMNKFLRSPRGQQSVQDVFGAAKRVLQELGQVAQDVWPTIKTAAEAIAQIGRALADLPGGDNLLRIITYWKLGGGALVSGLANAAASLNKMSLAGGKMGKLATIMRSAGLWGIALGTVGFALYTLSNQASTLVNKLNEAKSAFSSLADSSNEINSVADRRRSLQLDEKDLQQQLRGINQQLTGVNRPKKHTVQWELLMINRERTLDQLRNVRRDLKLTGDQILDLKQKARKDGGEYAEAMTKALEVVGRAAGKSSPDQFKGIVEKAKIAAKTMREIEKEAKAKGNTKVATTAGEIATQLEKIGKMKPNPKITMKDNVKAVQGRVADLQKKLNSIERTYFANIEVKVNYSGTTLPAPPGSTGDMPQIGGAGDADDAVNPTQAITTARMRTVSAWYRGLIKQQNDFVHLKAVEATKQKALTAAVRSYAAQYKSMKKGGFTDAESNRLDAMRSRIDQAREIRDRYRDAIENAWEKLTSSAPGVAAFARLQLRQQAGFARTQINGTSAAGTPFVRDQLDRAMQRFLNLAALSQKKGLKPAVIDAVNREMIELADTIAGLRQQALDLSTQWLDLTFAFAQGEGQDMSTAARMMIQGLQQILATQNFGAGLTPEQAAGVLNEQRNAFDTWLGAQSTNFQIQRAWEQLNPQMGLLGSAMQGGGAIGNRLSQLFGILQNGGQNFDGTFIGLSPDQQLSIMNEILGLLGEISGNTDETAANTSNIDNAAEEALKLLAQARLEGVMFTTQMSVLESYLASQVGQFASGTSYVARTGTAVVHKGESISSKHQSSSSSAGTMEHVFTIQGSDSLTNALAEALTPSVNLNMGRRYRSKRRGGV